MAAEGKLKNVCSNTAVLLLLSSRFCFQQPKKDKDGLFLFTKKSICQLSTSSGKTRKKFVLSSLEVSTLNFSPNGAFVAGLLSSGDLFIWSRANDKVQVHLSPFSKLADKIKPQVKAYTGKHRFTSS